MASILFFSSFISFVSFGLFPYPKKPAQRRVPNEKVAPFAKAEPYVFPKNLLAACFALYAVLDDAKFLMMTGEILLEEADEDNHPPSLLFTPPVRQIVL